MDQIQKSSKLIDSIFNISSDIEFEQTCLQTFYYQYQHNELYRRFSDLLLKNPETISSISQIPFLPIQFFKEHKVYSSKKTEQKIFSSSGTTGSIPSLHYIADLEIYERSFLKSFSQFYGNIEEYCVMALLPGYLEREGSSLVYMVEKLIGMTNNSLSGFYLYDHQKLIENLEKAKTQSKKIILIGVSYALLDLAEKYQLDLSEAIIMETGGMKGNRREMLKEEFHAFLIEKFMVNQIHSEYGMTELLSQAYSLGNGIFQTPTWMQIQIRDINDPFALLENGRTGGVNVIDLANIYSCSFIATQDLGRKLSNTEFEILGRIEQSDLRGCNLMVVE